MNYLASLYTGDTSRYSDNTKNTLKFLNKYFEYSETERELLMGMYRHKLVHLFQPSPFFTFKNKRYSWAMILKGSKKDHLRLRKYKIILHPSHSVFLRTNYMFSVVIDVFLQDIVYTANKYMTDLKKDVNLQKKYEMAIDQIFELKNKQKGLL